MDEKTNAVVDALRNGVEMMGKATETINDLRAKLAASEAACAQMRAALERGKKQAFLRLVDLHHAEECPDFDRIEVWKPTLRCCCSGEVWWPKREEAAAALHFTELALATDAGRNWLSPEEAERLRRELADFAQRERLLTAQRDSAERAAGVTSTFPKLVSEEECARRCREVALEFEYIGGVSEELVEALTELRATRAELAKVRAKSKERRRLLESQKPGDWPRGMWGPFCPWCRKYQPWSDEEPQEHAEDCALVAALRGEP